MLVLGIDTSCDDTSASVVKSGVSILSNIVSNQSDIHGQYGGIVPELASRRHIEMIIPVVEKALKSAGAGLKDMTAIAVCCGPGLIGSLLVGCSFAKAISYTNGIPLVAVNHLEGHIFSVFPDNTGPEFPFISLIVSGGHTSLYRVDGFGSYRELGRTRDDAAGEAYDKVSKILGLGYPGGPLIDKLSKDGDPKAVKFPRAYLPENLDFSFSGLKTAVLNFYKSEVFNSKLATRNPKLINDIAASFQAAVIDILIKKIEWAAKKEGITRVMLAGGVASNSGLRARLSLLKEEKGFDVFVPPAFLCTDNAAMIASAGYHHFINNDLAGLDLNPKAYLMLK